jgi:CIC family chloride channel protein
MGGFFAGVAKVPIAALIMVAEMTGGYTLIVPMMIVSSLAYLLLGHVSLYEKQVPTRVDSPAHMGDYAVDIMDRLKVKDALADGRVVEPVQEHMRFEEILGLLLSSNQQDFPIVDAQGNLTGIISITDLRGAMADKNLHDLLIAKDIAVGGVITVAVDDSLNAALRLMADIDVRELPVVSREEPTRVLSIISRKDITRAYHEEIERLRRG